MRRPRGPGGRFLTADEVAAMEKTAGVGGEDGVDKENVGLTPNTKGNSVAIPNSGGKRKADAMGADSGVMIKKSKNGDPLAVGEPGRPSTSADEEDEEDEDEGDDDG